MFSAEGYVIKHNVMPPHLCAAARDRLWEANRTLKLQRHNPETWTAPFPESDVSRDDDNFWHNRRWLVRSFGGEPTMMEMLPIPCAAMAEQLLGTAGFLDPRTATPGAVGSGHRCRGVYCTLPEPPGAPKVPAALQENFENDLEPVHWCESQPATRAFSCSGGVYTPVCLRGLLAQGFHSRR